MISPSPSILAPASSFFEGLEPSHSYAWTGIALLLGILIYSSTRSNRHYNAIPAVGSTGYFSSYISALQFFRNAKDVLQEGYDKYHPGVFRVPEFNRWHIIVTGEKLTEELRKASDDIFSFNGAAAETFATDYTMGIGVSNDLYHVGIVRNQLTRNLGTLLADVRDETALAFEDAIPPTDEWTKVRALDTMMSVVSRISNRIFVGEPTCRDPEFMALNIQFTIDVVLGARIINMFPDFLRPLAGRLFTNVPKAIRTGMKHLKPIIEERQRKIDEYGLDYPDKPIDLLSWLMDEATGEERSVRNLTLRVLILNFAAIHTSSMSFTQALFTLAARPEYIQPLRKEIESVVAQEGWNKVALTHMHKLDSFIKESQRLYGIGVMTMTRKAMKDYTLSDGTYVPKGAFISTALGPRHADNAVYPHSDVFDGFRFSNLREEDGEGTKNQMVATSSDNLTFGHGRHACPGRFFAANELKAMMAHVVLTYDVKMEEEGARPESQWYGPACVPNSKADVLFRKRRV